MTSRWICPRCDREFGRPNTAHVCVPGCTVDETFARRPEQRPVYEAVLDALRELGPVHEDAVNVGVFLKADHKIAELRPKVRWLQLALRLSRTISSPRVARVMPGGREVVWHVVKLHTVDDIDAELRGWLAEAYHTATDSISG